MKKILFLVLALGAVHVMAFADKSATVDCGESVKITATPKTGYHFVKWNDGNTKNPRTITPSADITYRAYFAINEYTITFENWNRTQLQQNTVKHGDPVAYEGNTPTKPSTAQYSYTFSGWSPNIVTPAVGSVTYVAQFDATVNKYTITFNNWDGSVLESKQWEYGQTPSYTSTPTRPADDANTYVFSGWDKTISTVTGAAVYTAQYTNTAQSYEITTTGLNGTTTGDGTYLYGAKVTLKATANSCYKFVKWSDGDTNATREITVTGTTSYNAEFQKIQYTVTVESDDDNQGSVSAVEVK